MNIERKPTEEEKNIVARFAREFGRIYQRVLDLENSEAQAQEANIEAALERIRSRAMAMQSSEELQDVLSVLFQQFDVLDIHPVNVFLTLFDLPKNQIIYRASGKSGVRTIGHQVVDLSATDIWNEVVEKFKKGQSDDTELIHYPKESLPSIFEIFNEAFTAVPEEQQIRIDDFPDGIYTTHGHFEHGYLGINHTRPATEEEKGIIARISTEFGRVYRRFLDLQVAEMQASESLKQASLDRVRGEIASMRDTDDLNRITPVIWRELTALEVPFIRCGVFIVDEQSEQVQAYLSTPDGQALGVLNLPFDINEQTTNTVKSWRKMEVYTEHWDADRFAEWTRSMIEMGQVESATSYQGSSKVPENLHLHFVPFRQGMLYVGDVQPLEKEKIELVKTLAEAFSLAYARYEDFQNLEEAKNKIESTLTELQATQAQLIQSEKMASLGELTAGIAHEIQNPLNFVNNFSDVSNEMIEEAIEEMAAGDTEEVNVILNDLKSNLEKITHHGHRASGIVRSMLEHSRASGGEKSETDVNALCDEYLRLAYHGMRAKDKSFNAVFELDLDQSLPKAKIISQDIGRVLLNLINNAFQAVSDLASKKPDNNYKPKVRLTTKNLVDSIEITVSDNGPGIPENIRDKVFQPFFTTKPTGQGTGLGLSLSYDIVKGHGGDIILQSRNGEGTNFIITIPIMA
jgi:signal transduction histidine kinase